jgi:hypothetical protein
MQVIDPYNLTILVEPGYEDLAQFLAEQQVEVVASLPAILRKTSINSAATAFFSQPAGLHQVNALGYGLPESGRC